MSTVKTPAPAPAQEIFYPSSDGEPMAETPIHIRALILLFQAMEDFLAALTDIYIGANMFWYWEEGDPQVRRAPDLMVIKGVGRTERRSFFSWKENGAVPCLIVEVASEKTWREDLYEKRRLYAQLGVREYFLFDPEAVYLRPALQGFRHDEHGAYIMLAPDSEDRLKSEELGLYLRAEGDMLRLIDAATGQPVLTRTERIAHLQALLEQAKGKHEQGQ
jgi:Uma2 family endonuclease